METAPVSSVEENDDTEEIEEEQSQEDEGERDFSSNLKLMRAPRFVPNYVPDSSDL